MLWALTFQWSQLGGLSQYSQKKSSDIITVPPRLRHHVPDKGGVDELDERRHFAVPDRPQVAEFGHGGFAGRLERPRQWTVARSPSTLSESIF